LGYQFTVPNMNYMVTLKFADPDYSGPWQRLLSASINGVTSDALANIDIARAAGGQYKPLDITVPVAVTNNQIDLAFSSVLGTPIVNAIEIVPASGIDVLPHNGRLAAGQTMQFSALVPGPGNSAVTWRLADGSPGWLTDTGLYTAPTLIYWATPVTIIATSVANTAISGSAHVIILPPDASIFQPIRLNVGGPVYTDPAGRIWAPDSSVSPGCYGGAPVFSFVPPPGVDLEYASGRSCSSGWGFSYQFANLPNMDYVVTLRFADPTYANAGQRVFSVSVNGVTSPALTNIDIAGTKGGPYKPLDISVPVTVTTGQINLAFNGIVGVPIINAIEIAVATAIDVLPHSVDLAEGQMMQFSALVPLIRR
jgi:hypothetical protein